MATRARVIVGVCSAAVLIQVLCLWAATGMKVWTRFPSEELGRMNESRGLERLLDPGAGGGTNKHLENEFALGLLPWPGFGRELLSVTTIGGPAALAGLYAMLGGRGRHSSEAGKGG